MLASVLVASLFVRAPQASGQASLEEAPIHYWEVPPSDRLAKLQKRLEAGEPLLETRDEQAFLREFLRLMEVPIESQVLVFSQTSAQNSRISAQTPRAIYFSDDCYVGWVQGGMLEVTTFDPKLGALFYLVDPRLREANGGPRIERPASCLNCHGGGATAGYPGLRVRSVFPVADGPPLFHAGTFSTRIDSPIEERWGGWYVSGRVGDLEHMGNALVREIPETGRFVLEPLAEGSSALASLEGLFNAEPYLAGPSSDVVALMVFEHQVRTHNALVQAQLATRQALHRQVQLQRALGEDVTEEPTGSALRVIEHQAEKVLRQLLFQDEIQIEDDGPEGGEAFERAFAGPRRPGPEGRSLRDLRLYERLFKYRCSYLIHSEAFAHLPKALKKVLYRRLHEVMERGAVGEYAYLGESERGRISSILRSTKPDLKAAWQRLDRQGEGAE